MIGRPETVTYFRRIWCDLQPVLTKLQEAAEGAESQYPFLVVEQMIRDVSMGLSIALAQLVGWSNGFTIGTIKAVNDGTGKGGNGTLGLGGESQGQNGHPLFPT